MSEMNNATNSEDRLESILDEVRVLKAKYDERAEVTGENFNVFSILDRERYEVTTHSAIIAELLNPHGSHSQGVLFLKLFLDKFQEEQTVRKELDQLRDKLEHIRENEFDKFKVEVETPKKNKKGKPLGQIDILIESGDICIVIENKICADDQPRQLGRYYEYALDTGKKHGIIYLTLGGDEPRKFTLYGAKTNKMPCCGMFPEDTVVCPQTRKPPTPPKCKMLPKDRVVCLSYKEFIDEWLDACIKKVACIPRIRETLHQYQMTVKKLTWNETEEQRIVHEVLSQGDNLEIITELTSKMKNWDDKEAIEGKIDEDSVEIVQMIIKNMSSLRTSLECEFWRELRKQLKVKFLLQDEKLEFQLYRDGVIEPEVIEDDRLEEYIKRRYGGSPGLTFRIPDSFPNDDHEVVCRITYEPSLGSYYLYYGFVLCKKDNIRERVAIKENDNHKKYLDLYSGLLEKEKGPEKKTGWLIWKERADGDICFADGPTLFNTPNTLVDVKNKERKEGEGVVDKLVDEISKVIKKISE